MLGMELSLLSLRAAAWGEALIRQPADRLGVPLLLEVSALCPSLGGTARCGRVNVPVPGTASHHPGLCSNLGTLVPTSGASHLAAGASGAGSLPRGDSAGPEDGLGLVPACSPILVQLPGSSSGSPPVAGSLAQGGSGSWKPAARQCRLPCELGMIQP